MEQFTINYYEFLGITNEKASRREIERAFNKKIRFRKYENLDDPYVKAQAEEWAKRCGEAKACLLDPSRRAALDLWLHPDFRPEPPLDEDDEKIDWEMRPETEPPPRKTTYSGPSTPPPRSSTSSGATGSTTPPPWQSTTRPAGSSAYSSSRTTTPPPRSTPGPTTPAPPWQPTRPQNKLLWRVIYIIGTPLLIICLVKLTFDLTKHRGQSLVTSPSTTTTQPPTTIAPPTTSPIPTTTIPPAPAGVGFHVKNPYDTSGAVLHTDYHGVNANLAETIPNGSVINVVCQTYDEGHGFLHMLWYELSSGKWIPADVTDVPADSESTVHLQIPMCGTSVTSTGAVRGYHAITGNGTPVLLRTDDTDSYVAGYLADGTAIDIICQKNNFMPRFKLGPQKWIRADQTDINYAYAAKVPGIPMC